MVLDDPRSILITGASSGIGASLARLYATPGRRLVLGGRDTRRLNAVAAWCDRAGARIETRCQDVVDHDAMSQWIARAFASEPVDLVIANAGISGGTGGIQSAGSSIPPSECQDQVERILATNVSGVVNTVFPAIREMRKRPRDGDRPRGQIAIMSSLAGFRGLPGAPAYGASKACVRSLGEGLRGLCARHGIRVNVICPGFIESPMTDVNPYPMPFLMPVEKAARVIRKGLARDRARIAFPWPLWAAVWLLNALPVGWTDPLVSRMPEKPAAER
jgi:NAD(P)-dependent dehydrogenase (short-subunit alcohol dehydrogenase family)